MKCECENCGKEFTPPLGLDWHDLCDVCNGPYEEALREAQLTDPTILRVPFPKGDSTCTLFGQSTVWKR